jgi:hypothetical protein
VAQRGAGWRILVKVVPMAKQIAEIAKNISDAAG